MNGATTARRNSSRRSSVTCGSPTRVTGLASGDHGLRRAAGALGVRRGGIDPEPQGHPDRVSSGAQKGDGAVDAPAHRDCDPGRLGRGSKDLSRARSQVRQPQGFRRARRPPRAGSAPRAAPRGPRHRQRRSDRRPPSAGRVRPRRSAMSLLRPRSSAYASCPPKRSCPTLPFLHAPSEPGTARWVPCRLLTRGREARTQAPFHLVLVLL